MAVLSDRTSQATAVSPGPASFFPSPSPLLRDLPSPSTSVGVLVPSVSKTEEMGASVAPPVVSSSETTDVAGTPVAPEGVKVPDGVRDPVVTASEEESERDKDLRCPICMGVSKDTFLTACGHSCCYMCIVTHLNNKSDCPRMEVYALTCPL